MKKEEQEKCQFMIHYYLADKSHSIDTFAKNSIEKDFLNIINVIKNEFNVEIKLESKVPKEGGFVEILDIIEAHPVASAIIASFVKPTIKQITELIKYFLSGKYKKDKLELEKSELENEKSELEKEKLKLEISKLKNENTDNQLEQKIARPLSNYYTKIEKYEKIEAVGFGKTIKDEYRVDRKEFKNFILSDDKENNIDDEANIELISPVLKEGKYRWRGIYKGENIDFSMGDSKFKSDIISGRYDFGNGSFINCQLHITKIYDNFGNENKNRRIYRVAKVYETKRDNINSWSPTHKGILKKRAKFKEKSKPNGLFPDYE